MEDIKRLVITCERHTQLLKALAVVDIVELVATTLIEVLVRFDVVEKVLLLVTAGEELVEDVVVALIWGLEGNTGLFKQVLQGT